MADHINVPCLLIDRRNYHLVKDEVIAEIAQANIIGLDTETHDEYAHPGIKKFRDSGKFAFDWQRIHMCGMSFYAEGANRSYYVNLGHADVENRLTWEEAKVFLDAKKDGAAFVCHNAPFEITVFRSNFAYECAGVICTMQMAVSTFSPDEYDRKKYLDFQLGQIKDHLPDAEKLFYNYDKSTGREGLGFHQQQLLSKVLGKQSSSPSSYNGMIKELAPGYGLKNLVKEHFNFQMETYEEVLKKHGAQHMGELTGEQVCAYGADDAYWAAKLFLHLYGVMQTHCPNAIKTFFEQENPMIYVFSDIRTEGLRIDLDAVEARKITERKDFAAALRELKAAVAELFPFVPKELNERLAKFEKWYADKGQEYRDRLYKWSQLPDSADDMEVAKQVSSSVTTEWVGDNKKLKPLNLTHYYQTRLFLYDLAGADVIVKKGKVQSDAETRGDVLEELKYAVSQCEAGMTGDDAMDSDLNQQILRGKKAIRMLELLNKMAGIEQRMKLYLAPYSLLADPETKRVYPEITSMLASRRMAGSNPNSMQLAKRGDSTYVRGFLLPEPDHVFIAPDWSQIELVEVGEFSGDPEFRKAYGQLPYEDLHMGAAADVLSVEDERVTEEVMNMLAKMDVADIPPVLLVRPNGDAMSPKDAKKFWRTLVGKGANFNYWYSGSLSTIAEKMGWDSEKMWKATEKYRQRFAVAEQWRVNTIMEAMMTGFIELPDGHRRYKWEATHEWASITQRMFDQFGSEGFSKFGAQIIRGVQTRAKNQIVNSLIQGTCATLAKRTILRVRDRIQKEGFDAQFKSPIHDELLYSVHRSQVVPFLNMIKEEMANHRDIIKTLPISCSVGMGRTFEPWDAKKAPIGLLELDECPELDFIPESYHGKSVPLEYVPQIVDMLFAA